MTVSSRVFLNRWRQILAVIFAAILIPLLAYSFVSNRTKAVPDYGGIYVEGTTGNPLYLNPILAQFNESDKDVVSLVFSGLTKVSESGEIIPDLAERWEVNPSGTTYVFYLRQKVLWHDGAPFTADDVVFTFKAIQSPDFPGSPDLVELWKTVTVEKTDQYVVKITMKDAYSPFLSYTSIGILPAHLLEKVPPSKWPDNPFNVQPVGTGPFRVREATVENVILDANEDYYLGKPYLSSIELRFFPSDDEIVNALHRREIHGALLRSQSREIMESLAKDPEIRTLTAQRFAYEMVFLNLTSNLFREREVRQAILYGIDRTKILRDMAYGQGKVANSPILPGTWAYSDSAKKYEFNPSKAASMLDAAGWKLGPDGIREKEGMKFRFAFLTDDDRRRIRIGEEVSRELAALGIKADLQASGSTGLIQNFVVPRKFDAALMGLVMGVDPDPYVIWHSSQNKANGFNFVSLSNKKVDELLEKARQTSNIGERRRIYGEFQNIFADELPSLLLYYPTYYYYVDKGLNGVSLGNLFEASDRFRQITQWYRNTKRIVEDGKP